MFIDHFKLKHQPFVERTPVDRILKDERIEQGVARLEYFAEGGDIALVTGHTGVGKSTLVKLFMHSLNARRHLYQGAYIHLTHVEAPGLLKLIVSKLGEVPKRGKENLFLQILEKTQENDLTTILVIDESHLIPSEALIDLRLLISSALEDQPPLKLVLVGQDSLRDKLKSAQHAALVHRISVSYHLLPFTRGQSADYIDFQIKAAGVSAKVFESEAKGLIHDYASGVPRQINKIATACLFNAFTKNLQKINEKIVNEAMAELHLP